jgi:hypothetical protein
MTAKINYEAKNDHELLIMVVQQLEFMTENCKQFRDSGECNTVGLSKKAKASVITAITTGIVALILGLVEAIKR